MADYLYNAVFADSGGYIWSSQLLKDVEWNAERSADKFNTTVKITKARIEWDAESSEWKVVGKWTRVKSVKPYRLRRERNPSTSHDWIPCTGVRIENDSRGRASKVHIRTRR